jgi:3-methyladenine DNA glycosylase/8-oxoguanine DNA glycosylase
VQQPARRSFPFDHPLDLARTVGPLRRGPGDPTMRVTAGEVVRAWRTPEGPATVRLTKAPNTLHAQAWGPGADAALEAAPGLAGLEDRPEELVPADALVGRLGRTLAGIRLTRTASILDVLVPTVLEQKIAGKEARRMHRALVGAHGEPAPGPFELLLPPSADVLASLPYHAFHPLGLERRRAEVIRRAAANASSLERLAAARSPAELAAASAALQALPGIGAWTAAEVGRMALGDPDAISLHDFHLPNLICWAFAGEPRGTDERMLELLEPYRGQRGRVQRLVEASGIGAPRFGPRMRIHSIARL